jgi:hypothetical protein
LGRQSLKAGLSPEQDNKTKRQTGGEQQTPTMPKNVSKVEKQQAEANPKRAGEGTAKNKN